MDRGAKRTLVVLLLIFAALLMVGLIVTTREANTPATPFPFLRVFPNVDENRIAALRLTELATGQALVIQRVGAGGWQTETGVPLTAEAALIARTLAALPYDRVLPEPLRAELPTLGLDASGTLQIEMLLDDGSAHAVFVGALAPTQLTYYALVDDRPGVYLILRPAVDYLITQLRNPPTS